MVISAGHWWLTPVVLATQEAKDKEDHSLKPAQFTRPNLEKNPPQKRPGGVAQM
jgi:hypothetical protein